MEIGSIFEINPADLLSNQEKQIPKLPLQKHSSFFSYFLNTGRSAIVLLLEKLKSEGHERVFLPSFICDSVRDAVQRAGMEICYYKVDVDLSLDLSSVLIRKTDLLYVVQFFGKRIDERTINIVDQFKREGIVVIEDISLSLLSEGEGYVGFGNYIIGSLRKWFPIIDGGILLSRKQLAFDLEDAANDYTLYYYTAQILKYLYLNNEKPKKDWKNIFLSYNEDGMQSLFSDYTLRKMSKISLNILRGIDFYSVRDQRIKNFDLLGSLLVSIPQVKILVERQGKMTPLGMVILCEERDTLLNYMISRDIYCNVHWRSNESTKQYNESEYLSKRCITIPCDQRYGYKEMEYIHKVLSEFYGVKNV